MSSSRAIRRLSQVASQTTLPSLSVCTQSNTSTQYISTRNITTTITNKTNTPNISKMAASRLHAPILFICDLQSAFTSAIHGFPSIVSTTLKLLDISDILSIPVYATTQSASKLGSTVPVLQLSTRKHLALERDKTLFSMYDSSDSQLLELLQVDGRPRDVILVGIETHICVTQTALDLVAAGHGVWVCSDGVSSCHKEEKGVALERLGREGVRVTTSESVVYEVLRDAKNERFRDVARVVKERKADTAASLRELCG